MNKRLSIITGAVILSTAMGVYGYKTNIEKSAEAKIKEKAAEIIKKDPNFKSIGDVICKDGLGSLTCSVKDISLTNGENNIVLKDLTITNIKDFARMYDDKNFHIADGESLTTNINLSGFFVDKVEVITELKSDLIKSLALNKNNPVSKEIENYIDDKLDSVLNVNAEYTISRSGTMNNFDFKSSAGIPALNSLTKMSFSYNGDISKIQDNNKLIGDNGVFKSALVELDTNSNLVQDIAYLSYKYTYNELTNAGTPGSMVNKELNIIDKKEMLSEKEFKKLALPTISNMLKSSVTDSPIYKQNALTDSILAKIDSLVVRGDNSLSIKLTNKDNLSVSKLISSLYLPFILQDINSLTKIIDIEIK
jgi:hypothetical protein